MLAVARAAAAQSGACRDAIPRDSLRPVVITIAPRLYDGAARAAEPTVLLFAEQTAARLRTELGAGPGQLPDVSERLPWQASSGRVEVVLYRDGRSRIAVGDPRIVEKGPIIESDTAGAALLARAASATVDADGPFFWDERVEGDSLAFELAFAPSGDRSEPPRRSYLPPVAFSVFRHMLPAETPVALIPGSTTMRYPAAAKRANFVGTVLMRFVVDSTGHVPPESIGDVWPTDKPRPTGRAAAAYAEFVEAARTALRTGRFRPATIGGCPVAQLVVQPFDFSLTR